MVDRDGFRILDTLKYDVICHGKVVLKAGTPNVGVKFRASPITFTNPETGLVQNLNVYKYNGKTYNGC